jgi:hypothetical protein
MGRRLLELAAGVEGVHQEMEAEQITWARADGLRGVIFVYAWVQKGW